MKFILIAFSFFISTTAHANWLNSFKDPSTLILNQRDCFLGTTAGEMADGNFIVGGQAVVAKIKKLDKSRVSYEMLRSDERRVIVLDVVLVNKQIVATLPNSRELIICNLR